MKEPFLSAVPVLKHLEDAGFEAYFVGGSVRDYLLNKPISDVDIATSATPMEVKQLFSKTVDIGIEHGTVLVLYQKKSYELTTFRTDGEYIDHRRPAEVSFIRNLYDDLKRRDFTMNAIAMDRSGTLHDPFNGQQAIKEKIIQTVGHAKDRFQEDALRMMRAVRFVSQLSFEIEKETLEALKSNLPLLREIAIERKKAEFEKLLSGNNRKKAMGIMTQTNFFSYLPGLANQEKHFEQLLSYDCEGLNLMEMWSMVLYCLKLPEKSVEPFLRKWRMAVKDMKEIQSILYYTITRLKQEWTVYDLYSAGKNIIHSSEKLYLVLKGISEKESISYWLDRYEQLPIKARTDLAVDGSDLMMWFDKSGGSWIKETLLKIEAAILEEKIVNDKQHIKEWLKDCSRKQD
ncbi:CCA tRNA nucleotidyltransferase [Bacillus sp. BRMEA1]|uniref:CCA tRNA nucleotidyltransferase n=1 Tax=Neobacillus endophyticus TaxID=2738405 RepID=UPI00156775C4|nr:CCA tRNA nucleotidyltransferase [Neobacillus endophyticus]NRD80551.1 CCA tRNA nucleotidyltransferase [Neobacillus endophyticus]